MANKVHDMYQSPEYQSWVAMKTRCENPNATGYDRYGGRGIGVFDMWQASFECFYADMGPRPPGTSLERLDRDGDYEPGNCVWATSREQARNRKSNRILTVDGVSKTMAEWAEQAGITRHCLYQRLRRGWDVREAIKGMD